MTDELRQNERLLWAISYRMTGLADDADEVVQETFARALAAPLDPSRPLRPWLMKVCTNLARDRLRARRRRARLGVWLPAPVPTEALDAPDAETQYVRRETASLAFLLALEALTPTQRAVLLLRDVFDQDAAQVADLLGTSPGAVRVAHHAARRALAAQDRGEAPDPDAQLAALQGFFAALAAQDIPGALAWLAPGVELRSDGGARYHAAKVPVKGAEKVLKFLAGVSPDPATVRWGMASLNGSPSVLFVLTAPGPNQSPRSAVAVTVKDGQIQQMLWFLDPDKLDRVAFP